MQWICTGSHRTFFPNQAEPSGFLLFLSELVRAGRAAGSPSPPQVVPPGRLALPTNAQECLGEGLVPCVRQMFRNVYECFGMTCLGKFRNP